MDSELDKVLQSYGEYHSIKDLNKFSDEQMAIEFEDLTNLAKSKQAILALMAEGERLARIDELWDMQPDTWCISRNCFVAERFAALSAQSPTNVRNTTSK